jgi:hypothetical protein
MKLPVRLSPLPFALVVAAASLACSSSGSSPSTSEDSGTTTTPDSSTATTPDSSTTPSDAATAADAGPLSFNTDIYSAIIQHHCVGCHGYEADGGEASGLAFGKLDMSSVDAGYANLVNVAAAGAACGGEDGAAGPIRVVPGSAATSLLWEKVNGYTTAPPCGDPMPKSGEIGDGGQAVVVQQIQSWINQGALP